MFETETLSVSLFKFWFWKLMIIKKQKREEEFAPQKSQIPKFELKNWEVRDEAKNRVE